MYLAFGAFYLIFIARTLAEVGDTDLNDLSEQQNSVKINKCCEPNELMVDSVCRLAEQYNQSKCRANRIQSILQSLHELPTHYYYCLYIH